MEFNYEPKPWRHVWGAGVGAKSPFESTQHLSMRHARVWKVPYVMNTDQKFDNLAGLNLQSIRKCAARPKFNYRPWNFRFTKMAVEWGSECVVNLPPVVRVLSVQESLTEFIMLSNDMHFWHLSFVDRAIWVLEKASWFHVLVGIKKCGCTCLW